MTIAVSLKDVSKKFGNFTAVQPFSLDIPKGSFLTLLGPSGCGKTTTLRMIAGLLDPTGGDITINGRRVNEVPIHKRNLGIVFQSYALFPHKTIFENIAFGLKYRKVSKSEITSRVNEVMELVQLPDLGDRYPAQLSGGQQQRIALARAIVIEPDVLLLDEPLSALDANLREDMRVELKRIQEKLGITTIFVTHDQGEALAMSDQICIFRDGKIEQLDTPWEVYNRPASEFVAQFLGASNILPVRVVSRLPQKLKFELPNFGTIEIDYKNVRNLQNSTQFKFIIRAEKLHVTLKDMAAEDEVSADGVIEAVDYLGQSVRYFVLVGETRMEAINTVSSELFKKGQKVSVCFSVNDCSLLGDAK